jgi:predicted dehydrogenase
VKRVLSLVLPKPISAHVMVRQAREMLRQGGLGELRQIHVEYFQDWAMGVTDQGDKAP